MYSEKPVKNSLRYLYRGAIHEAGYAGEAVELLLNRLDYAALAAAFQQRAERVYAYQIRDGESTPMSFHGRDLLEQQAVRLYENASVPASKTSGEIETGGSFEIWMKEDGNLVTLYCVSVRFEKGGFKTEYREIRGYPFVRGLTLNLERLTEELRGLYES